MSVQSLKARVNVWVVPSVYVIVAVPEEGPFVADPRKARVLPLFNMVINCPAAFQLSFRPAETVGH